MQKQTITQDKWYHYLSNICGRKALLEQHNIRLEIALKLVYSLHSSAIKNVRLIQTESDVKRGWI